MMFSSKPPKDFSMITLFCKSKQHEETKILQPGKNKHSEDVPTMVFAGIFYSNFGKHDAQIMFSSTVDLYMRMA